jgi:hypothetical protein
MSISNEIAPGGVNTAHTKAGRELAHDGAAAQRIHRCDRSLVSCERMISFLL